MVRSSIASADCSTQSIEPPAARRHSAQFLRGAGGEDEVEGGFTGAAAVVDAATQLQGTAQGHGEAEAGALLMALGGEKRRIDALRGFDRDAGAVIGDTDREPMRGLRGGCLKELALHPAF